MDLRKNLNIWALGIVLALPLLTVLMGKIGILGEELNVRIREDIIYIRKPNYSG